MSKQKWVQLQPSGELFHSAQTSPLGGITWGGRHLGITGRKSMTMRHWDTYSLVYVLDGSGRFEDETGLCRSLAAGDLMLHFPRHGYRYAFDRRHPWSEFFLQFRGPLFALWEQQGLLARSRPVVHLEPVDDWWLRLEAIIAPLAMPEPAQSLQRCLMLEQFLAEALVVAESHAAREHEGWYAQACTLIEKGLGVPPDWEDIASKFGISHHHFRRRFREAGGIAPGHYRSTRQIEWAQRLLQDPMLPIKQIADTCGFSSAYHFAARVKQVTGLTPAQFRQRLHLR